MNAVAFIIQILNILVNINTGFNSKGTIVLTRKKIWRKYRKFFFYDFLSLISIMYYII